MECDDQANPAPLGRMAVELCFLGKISAVEAAELLGATVSDVRAAMRVTLLGMGSAGREDRLQQR